MKRFVSLMTVILLFFPLLADEGMWMLPLIEKLNIQKMKGMGCTLTAEDIYSDKNTSLKDAVIVFGNGCTGVVVSDKGLIFTNHHCGYGAIQKLSSVDHNYLKNGYAAPAFADELPVEGLSVKFLVKIQDVTDRVVSQLSESMTANDRIKKQGSIIDSIKSEMNDGHYLVQVKSFYSGNEFYAFVFEEYKDIRFVFAPPASIGKFGGETDNWMWPRHTGDFSVFRVYAAPDGSPAEYSADNVPLQPKRFVAVSNKGYQPGDFTMIMGNPGSTSRYLTSWGIDNRVKTDNQSKIDVRGVKQKVWLSFMKADEAINIAYASKYARSSNYWKNSIGMNNAVKKLKIIERKQEDEAGFTEWINQTTERQEKYGKVLQRIEDGYKTNFPYAQALNYLRESLVIGVEMPGIASKIADLNKTNLDKDSFLSQAGKFYKDYYDIVDNATMIEMLKSYKNAVSADALPELYKKIEKKYKNNFGKYVTDLYKKSSFTTFDKFKKALDSGKVDFMNDPAILFFEDVNLTYNNFRNGAYKKTSEEIVNAERLYSAGLIEMAAENGKNLYPDANSTMRLTYGKVGGYEPADAVVYNYYSTTKGILQKEIPGDMEFNVPEELKRTIEDKNFGAYVDTKTGEMHVAFLSNNDITGGNSGSPIFNAKGELIGLAFDGNWESLSGDLIFEPNLQRTINVDIRYILFIMDKVYGAQRLIDELRID
jgi:hypothetical protein